MSFEFNFNEVDYVKLAASLYAYLYGHKDDEGMREVLALAIAELPDEPGFQKLAEMLSEHGELPTYDFLLDRGFVTLPWDQVKAVAGEPNKTDAEATIAEARWIRGAIDFRIGIDSLRDSLDKVNIDDVTAKLSAWISSLSRASHPPREQRTIQEIYRMRAEMHGGIQFMIKRLDDVTMGIEPGTVTVIGGSAGHGKTTMMLNMAYGNAIKWGISSVFVTMEVPKEIIRLWLVARHALHEKWEGRFNLDKILVQKALLNDDEYEFFLEVALDFETNPEYGKVKVLEWSDFSSFEISAFIERLRAEAPYQAVFIDYINVFKNYSIAGISQQYERINYVLNGLEKDLALGSNPQIPVVVGAQISRRYFLEYKASLDAGNSDAGYSTACFSEANQLEKGSYYAVTVYSDQNLKDAGLIRVQLLKHRGGDTIEVPFEAKFEPAYVFIGDDDFAGVGEDAGSLDLELSDLMG